MLCVQTPCNVYFYRRTVAYQKMGGGGGELLIVMIRELKRQKRRPNRIKVMNVVKDMVVIHGGAIEMRRRV